MKKFKAIVNGKWIKGTIWKRPYLSIEFTEGLLEPKYYDLPVTMAFWHAVEKEHIISIQMKEGEDELWYPV